MLATAYQEKNPSKVAGIRADTLSRILLHANIRAGANVLVFEQCNGLVVGALAERLRGRGCVLNVHETVHPIVPILQFFNFSSFEKEAVYSLPVPLLPLSLV